MAWLINARNGNKRTRGRVCKLVLLAIAVGSGQTLEAREPDRWLNVWPGPVPGETTRNTGVVLPQRSNEDPPATRIKSITLPRLAVFTPTNVKANGAAAIIFPGGGYNYVVADKEGSEAAEWLNQQGITAFVLHYRTKRQGKSTDKGRPQPLWQRPCADGQQAVALLRKMSGTLNLDENRIGVVGFSAGGQAAALVASRSADSTSASASAAARPNFAVLVYPWQLVSEGVQLKPELTIDKRTPPTILIHAHDDNSSSLSSVAFYTQLKLAKVPAELHIFENGGHGYGMRAPASDAVADWTRTVERWFVLQGLATPPTR